MRLDESETSGQRTGEDETPLSLPEDTPGHRIALWKLILRAALVTLIVFWLVQSVGFVLRTTAPKLYEYHLTLTTLPANDRDLTAWGSAQPDILYFQPVRLPHEFLVQAYCRKNLSAFPIATLNTELGKRGYVGKGKYVRIDLTPYGQALSLLIKQAIMVGIGLSGIYLARRRGEPMPHPFAAPARSALLAGLLGGIGIIGIGLLSNLLSQETPMSAGAGYPWGARILLYLLAIFGAGVSEEVLFRGYLFGSFVGSKQVGGGMLLTAYLFARVHDWNTVALIRITITGVVLAWLYYRKKTLAASILAHALNNAWGSRYYLFLPN